MNTSYIMIISATLLPTLTTCGDVTARPCIPAPQVATVTIIRTSEQQYITNEYHKELLKSLLAGLIVAPLVDGIRNNIVPNTDALNLHSTFGICRDQLTGQAKVVLSLASRAAYEKVVHNTTPSLAPGNIAARLIGVLAGLQLGVYGKKLVLG